MTVNSNDNSKFCKFFKNGLVYNNNTINFTISPCCYFKKSYIVDKDKDLLSQINNYRTEWNNEDVQRTCKICLDQEASGIHSYRMASFDMIPPDIDNLVQVTVAVNKQCNLACPTCGANQSSLWYSQLKEHGEIISPNITKMHQSDRIGETTQKFISLFEATDLSDIQYIKFGGGEPFLNDTHLKILELIPNPEQVVVQYTSNFTTTINKNIISTWEKFKLIKWSASIDGVNDRFEFLRWPYKWDKFLETKSKIINTVPNNVMFVIEHTLNPLNIFYYDEYEQWAQQEFLTNRLGDKTDFNIHYANGIMSLAKTQQPLRDKIYNKYGTDHKISKLLMQQPLELDTCKFVNYLDKLDQWRNTNWRQLFPMSSSFYV